jgi:phage-related tail protein
MSTTAGRELQALARINNAKKEIGEHILPIYASALEKVADVLESVTEWMKEHATATKVITISLTGLAAVLAVLGSLAIAVASVLGPLSILRYAMSLLGMRAAGTATRVGLLSRAWHWLADVMSRAGSIATRAGAALRSFSIMEKLAPVLRMGASAWQWLLAAISRAGTMLGSVGTWFRSLNILSKLAPLGRVGGSALLWLGRAALTLSRVLFYPWGAIIAAIGTAAYLIYDNWSELSPFFARLWDSIKETFNQSMMWFSSEITARRYWHESDGRLGQRHYCRCEFCRKTINTSR